MDVNPRFQMPSRGKSGARRNAGVAVGAPITKNTAGHGTDRVIFADNHRKRLADVRNASPEIVAIAGHRSRPAVEVVGGGAHHARMWRRKENSFYGRRDYSSAPYAPPKRRRGNESNGNRGANAAIAAGYSRQGVTQRNCSAR